MRPVNYVKDDGQSSAFINEPKDFITWDPKLRTGIPDIDSEHENLVVLCNDFYKSLLQNKDTEDYHKVIRRTLERCLNYAAIHFEDEEKLMIAANYDNYRQHKAEHEGFKEKVQIAYTRINQITISEAIKFAHYLRDWIQNHIAYDDKLYIPSLVNFLKSKATKPKE